MKRLREVFREELHNFLLPLWLMLRYRRQVRAIIDESVEKAWTWAYMWGKSPEEAQQRSLEIFRLRFIDQFADKLPPDWVVSVRADIPFTWDTWASE